MKKLRTLLSCSLLLSLLVPLALVTASPVSADAINQVSAHLDWSGIGLTPNGFLAQSITPHNVPSFSTGQVDWSINIGNTENSLWVRFTLSNNGRAEFAFFDVPAGSKVKNDGTATCTLTAGNAFQKANSWRSTCSAPLMPVAGETYNFSVKPFVENGSQWWVGYVTIESTGQFISLGRLENNPSATALAGAQNMNGMDQITFWKYPLPACSAIPDFSVTYGAIKTGQASQPTLWGTREQDEVCPGLAKIDQSAGQYRVNIGNRSVAGSTPTSNTVTNQTKPETPSFSLVNFVGNKVTVNVNLGTSKNLADSIYLVAPKLGLTEEKKVFGKISGSSATWTIDFDSLLSGDLVPLKIVSLKNGVASDPLEENFQVPNLSNITLNNSVPLAPKNVTSRVIGTSGIVTAVATLKVGSLVKNAYLFGSTLGIPPSKPIQGEVIATKVIFEVPITSKMAGKTFPYTVYFENEAGKSAPTTGNISIPGLPNISSGGIKIPDTKAVTSTVFCLKGAISRTFAAKTCPPGWKKQ
jgi:hypothetical protein